MNNLGSACAENGALEQAQAYFEQAVSLDPDYLTARMNLGKLYLQTNQPEKAEKQFAYLLEAEPRNLEAAFFRADSLTRLGDPNAAIEQLETMRQWYPRNARLYREIGMIYQQHMNNRARAYPYFAQSLQLDPNQSELRQMLYQGTPNQTGGQPPNLPPPPIPQPPGVPGPPQAQF